jgi:WXXGXW repeat (2 copies)
MYFEHFNHNSFLCIVPLREIVSTSVLIRGEKTNMKKFIFAMLLATMFLAAAPTINAQVAVGIRIGEPPRNRVVRVRPVAPGSDYNWVDGYWYPNGSRYRWHEGYWTRPPYEGAAWVGPRYEGGQYYVGYWNGGRGRVDHDHHWDNRREKRERDHGRYHDNGHDHDNH